MKKFSAFCRDLGFDPFALSEEQLDGMADLHTRVRAALGDDEPLEQELAEKDNLTEKQVTAAADPIAGVLADFGLARVR